MKKIWILSFAQEDEEGIFYHLSPDYVQAVENAGYVAIIIPFDSSHIEYFVQELDAFLIPWGQDVCPDYYFEEPAGAVDFCYIQDKSAFHLIDLVVRSWKPILWICRWMQLINVFFWGSLYQHIENHELHNQYEKRYQTVHNIRLMEGGFLENIFKTQILPVNSIHHQAIKELGSGLSVTAYDEETDVIEGFTHHSLPVYGFQWHPEKLPHSKFLFQSIFQ